MRPEERRETGQNDLFFSRLDQIIDPNHGLAKLTRGFEVAHDRARHAWGSDAYR